MSRKYAQEASDARVSLCVYMGTQYAGKRGNLMRDLRLPRFFLRNFRLETGTWRSDIAHSETNESAVLTFLNTL
jgi:polysaccharide pyruvyl transferase WcaK-like protein